MPPDLLLQKFEISLARHPGRTQEVLDDEHWDGLVSRNDDRTPDAGLRVDQMVSALARERKPLLLERSDQCLIRDRDDGRQSAQPDREAVDRHELRRAPPAALTPVSSFVEELFEGARLFGRLKEPPNSVADVLTGGS